MTRQQVLKPALLVLALAAAVTAADRPNIVVVLCDDLGYGDLGCFGNKVIQTPNLDRFAGEGMRLTSCYAAAANCSPARAGLLTGRTPYRAGIHNWIPMLSPMHLRRGEITLSSLLQKDGYTTCHVGKWHLNGQFNLPGQPQPSDHGFDYWFSTQNNALPNHRDPENFARNGKPAGPLSGYSSQLVVDEAIEWLGSIRDRRKPFFLFVCFHEPHEPIATAERFERPYRDLKDPSRVRHHGNVTQMDHSFGRLMRVLDTDGLRDGTLVFFTSDNGPAITRYHPHGSTGPLRAKKGHLYDGGIRVPGIIRWPGHTRPGSVSDQPISGLDVLPTVCEVTGTKIPKSRHLDGTSFLPALAARPIERTQPLYWHFNVASSRPKVALRDGDWKLLAELNGPVIRPFGDIRPGDQQAIKTATLGKLELYNLETDIGETTDLAERQPERLKAMRAVMAKLYREVREETPTWPAWTWPRNEGRQIIWAGAARGDGWRTDGIGRYAATNPPTRWSPTENIAWATPLPTRSNSLPVFTRDAVFTCIEPFTLAKLSLKDGHVLWQRSSDYRDVTSKKEWAEIEPEVAQLKQLNDRKRALVERRTKLEDGLDKATDKKAVIAAIEKLEQQEEALDEPIAAMGRAARFTRPITQRQYNGYTTATPITDGRFVWMVYGNRVVTCFDIEGNRRWATVLPDNPQLMWGHSASPLLIAGRLIVAIKDIVALDPATGRELWRTKYGQTWGSAVRAEFGGRPVILMANGRIVRPADGKVIGRVSGLERASPVVAGNTAFYVGERAQAFQLPDSIDWETGTRLRPEPIWEASPSGGGFSASPVIHQQLVYCASTRGILNVLDAKTGKTVYTRRLNLGNGPVWPSLVQAGKYVYISNRDGNTVVIETGREYREVARNSLEQFISTPVFRGERLFIRTYGHLYCIGKSASK